ncbi:energy transducer TonB [Thalassotalea marina]|uniref:TonB C-terminal domain-containing protein n=1 Tax=Thalassotalea marina TaxID=1673741 RepID=A0A919EIK8_9GAMM|nr:energy transducer TonB [Thalassotalea marina]GHF84842.1 hypothetical protein GCM10017161_10400 [Thalassotalea marina]
MKTIYLVSSLFLLLFSFTLKAELWTVEKRVNPKYPLKAIKSNIEGCVKLQFFINSDGIPQYIEPIKSSAGIFEAPAVKALSNWRYKPTESNDNKLPQRQTVVLSFSMSPDVDFNNTCDAQMTVESNDIDLFKQHRLSMPIDATSFLSLQKSIAKIITVLSDDELPHFMQSYSALLSKQSSLNKEDNGALLNAINGLDYFQFIALANVEHVANNALPNSGNENESNDPIANAEQFPLIDIEEFIHTWEISDLPISMDSELYDEISYRLLDVELLINEDGTAKLLDTCRAVSKEIKNALEESIAEWKITKKVTSTNTVRFIFSVPAPREDGAYVDCDADWRY